MSISSRRHFLAVTGTGAAAAGVATLLPASLAVAQRRSESRNHQDDIGADAGASLSESVLMACVSDLTAGEVTVINGSAEVTVTDPALAQRIAALSHRGA